MAIFNSYVSLPEGTWSPANWSKIPCSVPIHRDPRISWAQGNSLHWCHRWSPANVGSSHQSSDVHNRNSQVEIVSKWEIARGLPLEQKKSLAGPLSSFFFCSPAVSSSQALCDSLTAPCHWPSIAGTFWYPVWFWIWISLARFICFLEALLFHISLSSLQPPFTDNSTTFFYTFDAETPIELAELRICGQMN